MKMMKKVLLSLASILAVGSPISAASCNSNNKTPALQYVSREWALGNAKSLLAGHFSNNENRLKYSGVEEYEILFTSGNTLTLGTSLAFPVEFLSSDGS